MAGLWQSLLAFNVSQTVPAPGASRVRRLGREMQYCGALLQDDMRRSVVQGHNHTKRACGVIAQIAEA
jgi:hypothetical protein